MSCYNFLNYKYLVQIVSAVVSKIILSARMDEGISCTTYNNLHIM